jgi:ABC-type branched-subunit amino acid transport system ATPase component
MIVELKRTLAELKNSEKTTLLISHDMKVVMDVSDRVLVLNHGVLIADGTPIEIQNNPVVIEAYLGRKSPIVA